MTRTPHSAAGGEGDFAFIVDRSMGALTPTSARSVRSRLLLASDDDSRGGNVPLQRRLDGPHFIGARLPIDETWRAHDVIAQEAAASDRAVRLAAFRAQERAERAAAGASSGSSTPPKLSAAERALLRADLPIAPLLSDQWTADANVGVIQLILELPFSVQLSFVPAVCAHEGAKGDLPTPDSPTQWLALKEAQGLSKEFIEARRAAHVNTLCSTLGLGCPTPAPHTTAALAIGPSSADATAQHALANLLGSITFFHGRQLVPGPGGGPVESQPHSLITGVPSRSFFPRGFLW